MKNTNHLSKIILTESSLYQAHRIIQAIDKISIAPPYLAVMRVGCYVDKKILKQYAQNLKIMQYTVSSSMTGLGQFLPIPKQNHIILINPYPNIINRLFNFVYDHYPMIDFLLIKNQSTIDLDKITDKLMNTKRSLFYEIDFLKNCGLDLFFCGFDFDDPNFASGVAKALLL